MPQYKKLIRDKIPLIIEQNGQKANVRVLSQKEYKKELLRKLVEEAQELLESNGDLNERADVGEVLHALDMVMGWSDEEVRAARDMKNAKRGAFIKRLFLEEVV